MGGFISSAPAIGADGTLFVASVNSIFALKDNKLRWSRALDGEIDFSPSLGPDGTVYLGSRDNRVYALSPADGSIRWSFAAGGMISSPVVVGRDGKLYFGSVDGYTYSLNPDGSLRWKLPIGGMLAGAAVDNRGTLYFGVVSENGPGNLLYALSPEGEVEWSLPFPTLPAPALGSEGTIYAGSREGVLYAVGIGGSVRWSLKLGEAIYSSPALGPEGTVYVCYSDNANESWLAAVTPAGDRKWTLRVGSFCRSTPAVDRGGTVYVGGDNLFAVGADGTVRWQVCTGIKWASPALAADGSVCAGSGGYLYVVGRAGTRTTYLHVLVGAVAAGLVLAVLLVRRRGRQG